MGGEGGKLKQMITAIVKEMGGEARKPHLLKQMLTTIVKRKNNIQNKIEERYRVLL